MSLHRFYFKYFLVQLVMVFFTSCEERYSPEVLERPNNFLVVIGSINSNGITTIKLTRTQNLADDKNPTFETRAIVAIEEENGRKFPLLESETGTYSSSDNLSLNPNKRYRLTIRATGKEYVSDFVEVIQTPAIENVRWEAQTDGLQIYVNTRDIENDTRYYRWTYEETWEYTAPHRSWYVYIGLDSLPARTLENDIYYCWRSENSTKIHIGNTLKLSQDVVSDYPILKLPKNSEKLKWKYSILVKQYAQTKESYQYWEDLKQNTENIGTLYDPLPTQLTGNIKCLSNPEEPVIGYVSAGSVEEKRIFISDSELPSEYKALTTECQLDLVRFNEVHDAFASPSFLPITLAFNEAGFWIGYLGTNAACADCRVFGTKTRPSFWE